MRRPTLLILHCPALSMGGRCSSAVKREKINLKFLGSLPSPAKLKKDNFKKTVYDKDMIKIKALF
jgi:hypothetical protein